MELWTALVLGMAGSLHCAGMCGPLALALPVAGGGRGSFAFGRLIYNLGRITTYTVLGVFFGLAGMSLALAGLQRWVSLAAGLTILIVFVASSRHAVNLPVSRAVARLKTALGRLLQRRSMGSLAMLGALNGLLPCGLVYAACAGAVAAGGFWHAVEYMMLFGLGTAPMMLGIGLAGIGLEPVLRLKLQRLIPVCVVGLGLLLVLRGLGLGIPYLSPVLASNPAAGRLCH